MLLCVDAAWAKRMSLSLKLSSHWRPCKLPRTGKKGKKKEVTKLTMKVITRCIRALRRYQKTKNKTNVTEFETGDSLMALAERCKLCLNCKRTSEKCHEVKDPSPNDSKRRLKHCDLLGCDEPGARSQRQQRKTTVAVSSAA